MKKLLFLCALLLASCSSKEADEITLVCEGTEVTSVDNSQIKADVIKVKRTIRLAKQSVTAKSGINVIHIDGKEEGDRISKTKIDWRLQVDGSREIIEESFKDKVLGRLLESNSTLTVTHDKISGVHELRKTFEQMQDKSLNRYEKYSIYIDRISGIFKELVIEAPSNNTKGSVFRIETNGECIKGTKKF